MPDVLINSFVGLAAALIGAIVIIVGWKVAHKQQLERDIEAKRLEMRIQYLIEAYRRLEFSSNRPLTPQLVPDFERAIADIQLFGSVEQVVMVQKIAKDFADKGTADLNLLLRDLRDSLRQEIDLGEVSPNLVHLRISNTNEGKSNLRIFH